MTSKNVIIQMPLHKTSENSKRVERKRQKRKDLSCIGLNLPREVKS